MVTRVSPKVRRETTNLLKLSGLTRKRTTPPTGRQRRWNVLEARKLARRKKKGARK
jgi:hypothetical protein